MTIHKKFADNVIKVIRNDINIIGLAAGGSWINNEIDEFSDLDLILITKERIGGDKIKMTAYAKQFGELLSGFTGEHVGEPRVLICLYNNPVLHVDIKFITPDEFRQRIENPVILLDKTGELKKILEETESKFPYPDFQWIEDRFWIWVHYALLKTERGEYMEAFDFFGFLRMMVFGPLLHIRNGKLPRGVRKVEKELNSKDLEQLQKTIPIYTKAGLLETLNHSISLYRNLRKELYSSDIILQKETEEKVMEYFYQVMKRK